MKKVFLASIIALMAIFFVSCGQQSKSEKVLSEFKKLVEETEKNKEELSIEEFQKMTADFNAKFEALGINEINEEDFSLKQKLELTALTIRWAAAVSDVALDAAADQINESESELNQALNELNESGAIDSLKEGVEEALKEIEKATK